MSGIRHYSFREGDRSEYLANYLLSGLGLVTAITRQEDIGFDFYCQLADQEHGYLTFGYPFVIQVKSSGIDRITYGNSDINKWKKENIEWLFKFELPFFIGIVDKAKMQIDIYNCSTLRFLLIANLFPSIIEFEFMKSKSTSETKKPYKEVLKNWSDKNKGDGHKHIINIGKPLVTITNNDIYNNTKILVQKKNILRKAITMEQNNILFKKLELPYFHWIKTINTNNDFTLNWFYFVSHDETTLTNHYKTLGPGLLSLAINLRANQQEELLKQLSPILRKIPKDIIPCGMEKSFPGIFDNNINHE